KSVRRVETYGTGRRRHPFRGSLTGSRNPWTRAPHTEVCDFTRELCHILYPICPASVVRRSKGHCEMREPSEMATIALVDDDRNILTSVSIALESEGYRVETYTDGASALEGLTARPPSLAILDIKMPRMDGMELLRRLRQKS